MTEKMIEHLQSISKNVYFLCHKDLNIIILFNTNEWI